MEKVSTDTSSKKTEMKNKHKRRCAYYMSLGSVNHNPFRARLNLRTLPTLNADKEVGKKEYSLPVGMQNEIATLEDHLPVSQNAKNILLLYNPTIALLDICTNKLNIMTTKNRQTNVYRGFINNGQNLQVIKMFFNG